MKTLFILNDGPYGSERTYNGLRLAGAVARQEGSEVHVFLIGDAASAAHRNQKVPAGFYNVETMIGNVLRHGGKSVSAAPAWMRAACLTAILPMALTRVRWRSLQNGPHRRTRF